jgi:hypothetical protein
MKHWIFYDSRAHDPDQTDRAAVLLVCESKREARRAFPDLADQDPALYEYDDDGCTETKVDTSRWWRGRR